MNDTFGMEKLTAELTTDEGLAFKPYSDSRGFLSIGIGRNLSSVGVSSDEIDYLFRNDVTRACADLDARYPWWRQLPPPQARVLANLMFNMGPHTLSQFRRFLAAMQAGDWTTAADELRNSAWFIEVGLRGPRMISRLLQAEPDMGNAPPASPPTS